MLLNNMEIGLYFGNLVKSLSPGTAVLCYSAAVDAEMEIREQEVTGGALRVNTWGREGRRGEEGSRSSLRGKLDCTASQQRWVHSFHRWVREPSLSLLHPVNHRIWTAPGGGVTLGEAVIFNRNNSQRGLTAATSQLTTSQNLGGSAFHSQRGIWWRLTGSLCADSPGSPSPIVHSRLRTFRLLGPLVSPRPDSD